MKPTNSSQTDLNKKQSGAAPKTVLKVSGDKLMAKRFLRSTRNEWDALSESSKNELVQLAEILKAVKQGDFSVRLPYERDGILSNIGELLNDIIGLNEHM